MPVTILDGTDDLLKEAPSLVFGRSALLDNIIEQLA
jgi:hypothetical protein